MRKISKYLVGLMVGSLGFFQVVVYAGDIANGWSEKASITQLRHDSGKVDLLLTSSLAGCGNPSDAASWWRMPVQDSIDNKDRRALMYLAYAVGKKVKLRCENSLVSDVIVSD
jgi:hypothetical protein